MTIKKSTKKFLKEYYLVAEPIAEYVEMIKVTSSRMSADYLRPFFGKKINTKEQFIVLYLNRNNLVEGIEYHSSGGISGTFVDVSIIARTALASLASGVILCHNHPSGNINPSEADISITQKIIQALKLFEIKVLDHLILAGNGNNNYYSFADEGRL
jgi:DNA repair protein RadC